MQVHAMNFQNIITADSLIVDTLVTGEDLLDEDESLRKFLKSVDWKGFHRVYFSLPLRKRYGEPETEPATLEGTEDAADSIMRNVKPHWTGEIEKSWLDSKFKQLDDAYKEVWAEMSQHIENGKRLDNMPFKFSEVLGSFGLYQRSAVIEEGADKSTSRYQLIGMYFNRLNDHLTLLDIRIHPNGLSMLGFSVKPDFVLSNKKGYFFIKITANGLKHYIEKGGMKDTPGMRSIIKEVIKCMLATRSDTCIVSDLETSILMQLDYHSQGVVFDGEAIIPLKYCLFNADDKGYTFQAIIASVIYDQMLRVDDRVQEDNVKRLEKLVILEGDPKFPGNCRVDDYSPPKKSRKLNPFVEVGADYHSTDSNWVTPEYKLKLDLKQGEYELLQMAGNCLSTVLKLNSTAIDKHNLNVPKTDHVIIKIYDLLKCHDYFFYHDLRSDWRENVSTYYHKSFGTEIECYERIASAESSIRVPKMYGHGEMIVRKGGEVFSLGWGIMLEYLEKDEDQNYDEEELKRQLDLLESLGIKHNDTESRNIIVSKKQLHLIDFSHARLYD